MAAEQRISGHIDGVDRYGAHRAFPLMRCSAAIVVLEEGDVTGDPGQISAAIAELKHAAKSSADGLAIAGFPVGKAPQLRVVATP